MSYYNKEKLKERKLHPLEESSPEDVMVSSSDCAFVISQLKCFFANHRIPLE